MKKVLYIVFACIAVGLVSCDNEKISGMNDSVDERLDAQMKEWRKELVASENGWLANIHSDYGIYRFWMEFDDKGRVKMLTDNLRLASAKVSVDESSYVIRALQRPTLIFDTYSYVAVLNDPNNEISGGADNKGLVTDFEFEIAGYENGVFTMTGRINRVKASLTKATAEEKAAAQAGKLQDVITNFASYKNGVYIYSDINGVQVMYSISQRSVAVLYGSEDTVVEDTSDTYISPVTQDVVFDKPLNANGTLLTGLKWNQSTGLYVAVTEDGSELDIEEQNNPIIPLYLMLGLDNKRYEGLETILGMYPAGTNIYRTAIQTGIANASANFGMVMHGFSFTFERNDVFDPRLMVEVYVDRFIGAYAIPLTFNQDESMFTLSSSYDNANVNSDIFYDEGVSTAMINSLLGKTMRIDWTTVTYPGATMGSLIEQSGAPGSYADTGNIIYGAMY